MIHQVLAGNPTNSISDRRLITYLTNYTGDCIFSAEDYTGANVIAAVVDNQIYTVNLNFYQWEYPIAIINSNSSAWNAYDYYHLRTKICRRAN
jgi:hypothetical protein